MSMTAMAVVSVQSAPCDIFGSSGTPCVAAHSVVRALYNAYSGPLYQVQRSSDNATWDIGVLSAGGFANAPVQDAFCMATTCVIQRIYDQSPQKNHLTPAPPGGAVNRPDRGVIANALPTMIGGNRVYGAFFSGQEGYRIDVTTGVATGNDPETLYMVTSGTHYNRGCCFDYGNAEVRKRLMRAYVVIGLAVRFPFSLSLTTRFHPFSLGQQSRRRGGHNGGSLLRQLDRLGPRRRQRSLGDGRS